MFSKEERSFLRKVLPELQKHYKSTQLLSRLHQKFYAAGFHFRGTPKDLLKEAYADLYHLTTFEKQILQQQIAEHKRLKIRRTKKWDWISAKFNASCNKNYAPEVLKLIAPSKDKDNDVSNGKADMPAFTTEEKTFLQETFLRLRKPSHSRSRRADQLLREYLSRGYKFSGTAASLFEAAEDLLNPISREEEQLLLSIIDRFEKEKIRRVRKWDWVAANFAAKTQNSIPASAVELIGIRLSKERKTGKAKQSTKKVPTENFKHINLNVLRFCKKVGLRQSSEPIYKSICHNCGYLFPAKGKKALEDLHSAVFLKEAKTQPPQVEVLYDTDVIENLNYTFKKQYVTCSKCARGEIIQTQFPMGTVSGGVVDRVNTRYITPPELASLTKIEKAQVALIGSFQHIVQRSGGPNFMKTQGKFSFYYPKDHYKNLFSYFINEDPDISLVNPQRMRRALRWLRRNNHLYSKFLSNYETVYGLFCNQAKKDPTAAKIITSGVPLRDYVHKEIYGLLLKNIKGIPDEPLDPAKVIVGIQHHKDQVQILMESVSVKYNSPYLEEKAFPILYPLGYGGYNESRSWLSKFTQQEFSKWRLKNADPRFASDPRYAFFMLDRILSTRIFMYGKHVTRVVDKQNLREQLVAGDLKEDYDAFGSSVPHTIPGSISYFRVKFQELLAMCRKLGMPKWFVTLTANDYWPELQQHVCNDPECAIHLKREDLADKFHAPPRQGHFLHDHPRETVEAFSERLRIFKKKFLRVGRMGPLGIVTDYWIRWEYQARGAIHVHMLIWIKPGSAPQKVVWAEKPRYSGRRKEERRQCDHLRAYVDAFQIHHCVPSRCRRISTGIYDPQSCKYGFPADLIPTQRSDPRGLRFLYPRSAEEDRWVVPYNPDILMLWEAHHNIQEVTAGTIEMYVSKYITKPEKSIRGKPFASQQQAFENLRICGILEAIATLFQKHQVDSTRSCPYMQTTFNPRYRRLLQPHRLPTDPESEKVYCSNLLEKYLSRPHDPLFNDMLYEDYINDYNVSTQASSDKKQTKEKQKHQWIDDLNFVITKNAVQRIGHWKFIYPTKEASEAFYEQKLILSVPLRADCLNPDGSFQFHPLNQTQTYMEECCLRGIIITEEEMKKTIQVATSHGFSRERVMQIVNDILSVGLLSQSFIDEEIIPWLDQHIIVNQNHYAHGAIRDNSLFVVASDLIEPAISTEELEALVQKLTPSQLACYNWFQNGITTGQQLLGIVTGPAGTGKSLVLDCLRKVARSLGLTVAVCGTTGVASYLIRGHTLHRYLLIDGEGECRLQRGTVQTLVIEDSDVIFVDEFSMLESNLLSLLDINCRRLSKKPASPFGGKHVILFGDPAQLPPVQDPVYCNPLLQLFRPAVLKDLVRQKDPVFANILQRLRLGVITINDKVSLRERLIRPDAIDLTDVNNIIICSRRYEVEEWNSKIVSALPGEATTFIARDYNPDGSFISRAALQDIKRYCPSRLPDELQVKPDCICFINRNLDVKEGWVNGTRVRIVRCNLDPPFIIVENLLDGRRLPLAPIVEPLRYKTGFENYDKGITRKQFPLRLGHASTVHSLQGCTLTCKVYVNLNHNFFASGQAYVALSRVKSLDQLYLLKTNFTKIFISEYAKTLLQWMNEADVLLPNPSTEKFPLQDEPDNTLLLPGDDESDSGDEEDYEKHTPTKRAMDSVKSKSNEVRTTGLKYGSPGTDGVSVRKVSAAKIAKRTPAKRSGPLRKLKKQRKPKTSDSSVFQPPSGYSPKQILKRAAEANSQGTSSDSSTGLHFSLSSKYPVSTTQQLAKLAKEAPPPKRLLKRAQAIRQKLKRLSLVSSSKCTSTPILSNSSNPWSPTTYQTNKSSKQIQKNKLLKRLQPRNDDSGYHSSGLYYSLSDACVVSPSPRTPKVAKRTPPRSNTSKSIPQTPEHTTGLDILTKLFEDISLTPKTKLSHREVQSIANIDDVPTKEYLEDLCQQIYSLYNTSIISLTSNHNFFKRACIFLKYFSNYVHSLFPPDDVLTPVPEVVEIVSEFNIVLDLLVSLLNCESYRTITQIGDFTVDTDAKSLLPPCLHGELTPVKVAGDGNCYYRSIAVHVFGNTDLYFVNKFLSGYVLISRQSDFERWVPQRHDNYYEEIGRTFKNYVWAGTWQILATSILLRRPIANYSTFREPAFDPEMTADGLRIHFQNDLHRDRSILGGMHTLTWTEDDETTGAPLLNLYHPYRLRGNNPNHYVPLIKADRGYRPPMPLSNPVARIVKPSTVGPTYTIVHHHSIE